MTENIKVVTEVTVLHKAYNMGYSNGSGGDSVENPVESLSHYKATAQYINNTAPSLRAVSGYTDSGHGTYQTENKVAVIPNGSEDDSPADAELMGSYYVYEAVQEAYNQGFLDAVDGKDADDSRTELIV